MTDELMALPPCPFCGGHAEWVEDPEVVNVPYGLVVKHAPDCIMAGNVAFDRTLVTAAWSRRTDTALPRVSDSAATELMALLDKAGFTRLVADYLPENEEGFPVGWRIHDHPDNSHVANMICDGIENEDEAAAIVAAVNFCRTELPALIEREKALREADRRKTETLKKASAWFLDYARQHDAKTPPDTVKAGTNYERAQYCETAAFDDGSPAVDAALWPELQEGQP